MMGDVYVLDKNLETIGVIDSYKSLIWASRYDKVGDCELYCIATTENLQLLRKDNYLMRLDNSMVCQIKKIELDTSAEDGNYLIVTGIDAKSLLDQRIIWSTLSIDGNIEDFCQQMVSDAFIAPALPARKMTKPNGNALIRLGYTTGLTEVTTEQVTYKSVGEKIRDFCNQYKWGYRFTMSNNVFWFQLYKGTDRTDSVIFSSNYENLNTTKYIEDNTNIANVALVAGEGQGSARSRNVSGYAEGTDRYEIYVDAKDISKTITWSDLTDMYPTTDSGGQGYIDHNGVNYVYKMNYLNVEIVDSDQLTQLKNNYPDGQEITISGNLYYQVYNATIANLPNDSPEDSDNVELWAIIYEVYLLTRGYEKLAEYGAVTSFEGTVEPNTTFIYNKDYFLGDLVTIQNEYGITVEGRITEVIEVNDDNGYSVEPKFEYISTGG